MDKKAYGIDLGTTFSAISHITEYGVAEVICNQSDGDEKLMPSVVQYRSNKVEDGTLVGTSAANEAEIVPERTVEFAKRYIDRQEGDYIFPPGIPSGEGPVQVSSEILKAMKKYAAEAGHNVENVVITVPAYFGVRGRDATRRAATIAGLNVLHVISEPTAAAMYYCENERPENNKILVYDLGGGTFDVVVVQTEVNADGKLVFRSLAVDGNKELGGKDFDDVMLNYIFSEAKEKLGADIGFDYLDADERQKIRDVAVSCKRVLSQSPSRKTRVRLEGTPVEVEVTRTMFESLSAHLIYQTMGTVDKVLDGCNLTPDDIDLVLLVGGSTFMPMVQNAVRQKFGDHKVKLNRPNEAVALGAAVCAQKIMEIVEIYNGAENIADINAGAAAGTSSAAVSEEITSGFGEIVSHSFGAIIDGAIAGYTHHIDNLIFAWDAAPAEYSQVYWTSDESGLKISFYENDCRERKLKLFDDCNSVDEYFAVNAANLIFVTIDPATQRVLTCSKPNVKIDYVGSLDVQNPEIRKGDEVRVTIRYDYSGAFANVEHVKTGKVYTYNLVHGSEEQHNKIVDLDKQRAEVARSSETLLA